MNDQLLTMQMAERLPGEVLERILEERLATTIHQIKASIRNTARQGGVITLWATDAATKFYMEANQAYIEKSCGVKIDRVILRPVTVKEAIGG